MNRGLKHFLAGVVLKKQAFMFICLMLIVASLIGTTLISLGCDPTTTLTDTNTNSGCDSNCSGSDGNCYKCGEGGVCAKSDIGICGAAVAGVRCCKAGSSMKQPVCPTGTKQCGYGCLVLSALCCNSTEYSSEWDQGTFECPGAGVSTCVPNTNGSCKGTVGDTSTYCCSTNSNVGSLDCKNGTVVCNQNCVPVGSKCCSLTNPTNCGTVGGVPTSNEKYSCSGNSCVVDPNGTYTSSNCNNACSGGGQYCYSNSACIPSSQSDSCECGGSITSNICESGHPACISVGGHCGDSTHICCPGETCINNTCVAGCGQCAGKGCH